MISQHSCATVVLLRPRLSLSMYRILYRFPCRRRKLLLLLLSYLRLRLHRCLCPSSCLDLDLDLPRRFRRAQLPSEFLKNMSP
jgi:hypothetical protein